MPRIFLSFRMVIQHSRSPAFLVNPHFRVDADVADKLEAADPHRHLDRRKQRVDLGPQPTFKGGIHDENGRRG
ncbi:hypothetical protein GW17_00007104 [Ensete ventricosum]|nr:hypothetical protein GW17_00007104 [Ensete ventricosum]